MAMDIIKRTAQTLESSLFKSGRKSRRIPNPKMMLVVRNGRVEEDWPPVAEHEPDGSYRVDDFGKIVRYEHSTDEDPRAKAPA